MPSIFVPPQSMPINIKISEWFFRSTSLSLFLRPKEKVALRREASQDG